jgi:hypothetical protein
MADPQTQPIPPEPPPREAEFLPPDTTDLAALKLLSEGAVNQELTVVQERSLFGDLITAQPVKKARNPAKILQDIDVYAAMGGERWYYRYPVRNRKTGRTDHIEGPSVKATNAVARLYGNCAIESRTMRLDEKTYVCYSRFADLESGFTITKGQLVPRSATLGGEDEERRQQIAHNIGQSKSQRNVIEAALGDFVHRAFLQAKDSIVARIGRNIDKARERIVELIVEVGKDKGIPNLVSRVEYTTGRKVAEWLAPDIAGIHAEVEAVRDGFASIDEQWPLPAPPEPRRNDTAGTTETTAGTPHGADQPFPTSAPTPAGTAATSQSPPEGSEPPSAQPRNWSIPPDLLGQDAVIKALTDLLDMTESDADQDEFERQNAERIAKITGVKGQALRSSFAAKRRSRDAG